MSFVPKMNCVFVHIASYASKVRQNSWQKNTLARTTVFERVFIIDYQCYRLQISKKWSYRLYFHLSWPYNILKKAYFGWRIFKAPAHERPYVGKQSSGGFHRNPHDGNELYGSIWSPVCKIWVADSVWLTRALYGIAGSLRVASVKRKSTSEPQIRAIEY